MNDFITRRKFIRNSGLAVGGLMLAGCTTEKIVAKEIPVGLQLYSVRVACENDFAGTIAKVAAMGYQGVEFAGFYDNDAKAVRKMLDDNGLQCCGSHTGLDTVQGDALQATIEYNQIIGNKYLIVPWLQADEYTTRDSWLQLTDNFNGIIEKLKPHGMRLGYHNHAFEFDKIDGEYIWDILMSNTDPEFVQQIDTGNCLEGGGDPLEFLRKYPGRSQTIHLKAYSESNPDALIGEDEVPWQQVFNLCETVGGTEWYIIEEEKDVVPPLEGVATSLKNLKKMRQA